MLKSERIVSYTTEELDEMIRRGEDRTDWDRVRNMTEEEIEASIDHDEEGATDWSVAYIGLPASKNQLTIRLDRDVIDWFKSQGPGYQTRMNAVLRTYVDAQKQAAAKRKK